MPLKITLDLPTEVRFISAARAISTCLLKRLFVEEDDIDDISVVIGELCANAVRHVHLNKDSQYWLEVEYYPQHVDITVRDNGRGFNRSDIPPPSDITEGGRGIWLVENLSEKVEFSKLTEGGTLVKARLKIRYKDNDGKELVT